MTYFSENAPLVSVIIPIYNVEKYLARCIDSVLNQTYKYLEIILVDDGSPDNCGEICDNYAIHDKRIVVIHGQNEGLSSARNKGIEKATGEYVTFIDSDDFVHHEYISFMLSVALENGCDLVQCDHISGTLNFFPIVKRNFDFRKYDNKNVFYDKRFKITAWAKLYKKGLIQDIRFPVGRINEDEFFTYKVVYESSSVLLVGNPLYYYYQSPLSIMRGKNKNLKLDFIYAYEERIGFFQKKNEPELVENSKKELAIRLMLYYAKFNKADRSSRKGLVELAKANVSRIAKFRNVPFHEKAILLLFIYFPTITVFFVNLLFSVKRV